MRDETTDLHDETVDGQHINPDGETDAEKGARIGGIGGAITGGIAGAAAGPLGAVAGAVIGGVVGAVASGAAVAAIDHVDGDSVTDSPAPIVDNGIPGVQTGGYAVDGTPDTRGISEKTADALTGDHIDDKTGRVVSDGPPPLIDNGTPGIQTGGHAVDGTPDTRGISEKTADALTGDNIDDKTGKRVS